LLTPALADAIAKCVVFGVLPVYGAVLLIESVSQSVRSGAVWVYRRGWGSKLYKRTDDPVKFWFALSFKAVSLFSVCAVPLILCVLFFLPRLIAILRPGVG
jgi:hypothetical protein